MSRVVLLTSQLSLEPRGNRRERLVIFSAMLSLAAKGVSKTELMYKVGLSSAQMDRFMPVLIKAELLEVFRHSRGFTYQTTDKGRSFLNTFDSLVRLLD